MKYPAFFPRPASIAHTAHYLSPLVLKVFTILGNIAAHSASLVTVFTASEPGNHWASPHPAPRHSPDLRSGVTHSGPGSWSLTGRCAADHRQNIAASAGDEVWSLGVCRQSGQHPGGGAADNTRGHWPGHGGHIRHIWWPIAPPLSPDNCCMIAVMRYLGCK